MRIPFNTDLAAEKQLLHHWQHDAVAAGEDAGAKAHRGRCPLSRPNTPSFQQSSSRSHGRTSAQTSPSAGRSRASAEIPPRSAIVSNAAETTGESRFLSSFWRISTPASTSPLVSLCPKDQPPSIAAELSPLLSERKVRSRGPAVSRPPSGALVTACQAATPREAMPPPADSQNSPAKAPDVDEQERRAASARSRGDMNCIRQSTEDCKFLDFCTKSNMVDAWVEHEAD